MKWKLKGQPLIKNKIWGNLLKVVRSNKPKDFHAPFTFKLNITFMASHKICINNPNPMNPKRNNYLRSIHRYVCSIWIHGTCPRRYQILRGVLGLNSSAESEFVWRRDVCASENGGGGCSGVESWECWWNVGGVCKPEAEWGSAVWDLWQSTTTSLHCRLKLLCVLL